MGRKILTYGAVLIGGYIVVKNYIGAQKVASSASNGGIGFVKALQGR